jgi:hypothetical protein
MSCPDDEIETAIISKGLGFEETAPNSRRPIQQEIGPDWSMALTELLS